MCWAKPNETYCYLIVVGTPCMNAAIRVVRQAISEGMVGLVSKWWIRWYEIRWDLSTLDAVSVGDITSRGGTSLCAVTLSLQNLKVNLKGL